MRERPCDSCGMWSTGNHHNSHVGPANEKGVGYKAGWEWVITQCFKCHQLLGELGSVTLFDIEKGTDLRAIARRNAEEIPA